MGGAAGEGGVALRVTFDHRLKLEFHGSKVTSDAGLLAFRELDDALGLTVRAGEALTDTRTGQNSRHTLAAQIRQSIFGRLAGYEDVNDADRLGRDPAMRWVVGGRAVTKNAASTSQMGRFETEVLTQQANFSALADLSGRWIDAVHARHPVNGIVLDMDSSVSPTHGEQEGTAYNGHFGCTCYHPLFVFNQFGDLERCALRPGNVHSAEGWRDVLEPVVARYRDMMKRRYFRADAAFASPEVYKFLEAEGYGYAIRLPANAVLQRRIAHLLTRPVGRPPHEVRRFYASFRYQAETWSRSPGRKVEGGNLRCRAVRMSVRGVVAFKWARHGGEWIREGKNAVGGHGCCVVQATRCDFAYALAYNLANFLTCLADEVERWSLTHCERSGEDRREDHRSRPL